MELARPARWLLLMVQSLHLDQPAVQQKQHNMQCTGSSYEGKYNIWCTLLARPARWLLLMVQSLHLDQPAG
jgi:hypothetical protein